MTPLITELKTQTTTTISDDLRHQYYLAAKKYFNTLCGGSKTAEAELSKAIEMYELKVRSGVK